MFFLLKENEKGFLRIIDYHYSHSRVYGEIAIKNLVNDNQILSEQQKHDLLEIIQKKKYERFLLFKYLNIWKRRVKESKYKKQGIYNNCDLQLKEWDKKEKKDKKDKKEEITKQKNETIIIDNYKFRVSELKQIIQIALEYIEDNYSNPLYPKNPYTNNYFTKIDLSRIYKKFYKKYQKIPYVLRLFEYNDFDIKKMLIENENYFCERIIDYRIKNITYENLIFNMKNIFKLFKKHINELCLRLNKYIIDIAKPMVKIYFKLRNTISNESYIFYKRKLRKEFDILLKLYPYFDNSFYILAPILVPTYVIQDNNKRRRMI